MSNKVIPKAPVRENPPGFAAASRVHAQPNSLRLSLSGRPSLYGPLPTRPPPLTHRVVVRQNAFPLLALYCEGLTLIKLFISSLSRPAPI